MAKKKTKPAPRKPRTDALRNRERILDVAKEAFTRDGANASLDEIARRAGVGAGTLYRHFPKREALIEAVYRSGVEKLAAAQREYSEKMPPLEAMRTWMLLLVDFIAAKKIIAPALNSIIADPSKLIESSKVSTRAAFEALAQRAMKNGDLRPGVEPTDLMQALIGASYMSSGLEWEHTAKRLVDILIAGARTK